MAGKKKTSTLQESKSPDYQHVFRASKDVLFITTRKGEWIDFSDAAVDLFGFSSREELSTTKISSLYAKPSERKHHIGRIDEAGFVRDFPLQLVRKDGSSFAALITTTALRDAGGIIIAYIGTIRDVSTQTDMHQDLVRKNDALGAANDELTHKKEELRGMVDRLAESEGKFRSLFNAMMEGVALHEVIYSKKGVATDYTILEVNPAFEMNTGISRDTVRGRQGSEVYGTGEAPFLDIYATVASTGTPASFESYFPPLGRHFHISVFSPGKGLFATVFTDISEQKRQATEREEIHRKLLEQHALFSGIIDSAISNIFSVDRAYRYTSFNHQHAATMQALFGTEIADGKSILDCITLEKDRRNMKGNLDRALTGEAVMDEGYTGDHTLNRLYMEPSFNPIRNPEGEVIGVAVVSRDTSERKKTEKALKASEERYRRLTENSQDIIFRLSLPDRKFEYISPACLTLTGYSPDEFYQNPNLMQEIIHPDFFGQLKTQWEKMPRGEIPREYEYQVLRKSGKPRWLHQRNTIIRNSTGHVTALEGIVTDITDRKEAEIALKQIEKRYHLISENTGDVIWILNLDSQRFSFISPAIHRLLGYTPEESVNLTIPQILTPESLSYFNETLPRALEAINAGDEAARIQTHHVDQIRKDGSVITVEIVATIMSNPGTGNTEIIGVSRDISERKRAADALKESEEKYRTLVETTSDLVWEINTEGNYTYISPKVRDMLGYEPHELIGTSPFAIMPPDEAAVMMAEFSHLTEVQQPVAGLVNRCLHKNGTVVIMETSAVPIYTKDGVFTGYRGIDRDVTQKILAQQALEESEARYRTITESANEAIFVIQNGFIPFSNKKGIDMIGFDAQYLATHSFLDLVHPSDRAVALERHNKRLTGEVPAPRAELRILDADGQLHWMEISAVLVSWNGKPATLNFATDITERKQADEALQESERSYHGLFNTVREAIYIQDAQGRFLNVNDGAVAMYGYPREFFIGRTPADISPEGYNDLEKLKTNFELAFQGEPQQFEFWGQRSNGEVFPKDVHIYKGSYFGKDVLIAVATDITERKQAEDALKESERHYHLLADNVSDVIWTAGKEMDLTYISPSIHALTGYSPEEFMKLRVEDSLTAASYKQLIESRNKTLSRIADDIPDTLKHQVMELEYRRKDGTTVWAEVVISLLQTADGHPQGIIGVTRNISRRREIEQALMKSQMQLGQAMDLALLGNWELDVSTGMFTFNDRFYALYGTTAEREGGYQMSVEEYTRRFLPVDEQLLVAEATKGAIETADPGYSSQVDHHIIRRDGVVRVVSVRFSVVKDTEGKTIKTYGANQDITDRKQAEKALLESEIYLKTIIDSVQTGLVIVNPENHHIVDVNPAAEKLIGENRQNLIGTVCHKYICPADVGNCPVTDHGYTVDNSERTLLTKGGPRSILKTVVPTSIGGRKLLLESFIDITDRKQAEERLAESEEKFHLIFKNSNDAIYLFEITPSGMPGRIVDANDVALLQTGQSRDHLLKRTFLEIHSHELPQKSRSIMMELLTKGQVRFETEVVKRDSTKLPVEVSAQFARLNQKTYVIAISRDISRRKREERALRIANQKLQLMNIVAWHDIQNKVTGLRGYVELSKDFVNDEQLKKFINSEEEVLKVIHQQLQYTKEYQEMGVHPQEWVNLHQTLRMVLSLAELGSIQMIIDVGDLEIFCDPVIAKVFSHLIDNTKIHGTKASSIHISYRETPEGLTLVYEDNGIGIPEEQKKELFLRNVGSPSGFSLFFIHDLLEVSEMTIRESGTPGDGVRFEIGIPRGIYRFGH